MPSFDPELIAALAEGRLDPQEAEALEREIGADPEALAALAAQRLALMALRAADRPTLTAAERTELRRRITEDLGLETVAAQPATKRSIPWGSIAVAGAALVGIIAVVPVVGLLTTSGDADDAGTIAAEAVPTTTGVSGGLEDQRQMAETPAAPGADGDTPASDDATLGTLQPGEFSVPPGDGTTPPAAATTTESGQTTTSLDGATTTGAGPDEAPDAERVAWLEAWRDDEADPLEAHAVEPQPECWDEASEFLQPQEGESLFAQPAEHSGTEVDAFFVVDETGEIGRIAAFALDSCERYAWVTE